MLYSVAYENISEKNRSWETKPIQNKWSNSMDTIQPLCNKTLSQQQTIPDKSAKVHGA